MPYLLMGSRINGEQDTLVYQITQGFPKAEQYGLVSQMRRAAVSIPANIAEGFKRFNRKEFRQFLHISLGSAAELETELIIANRLGYLEVRNFNALTSELEQISKMISALLKKL